jgi:hypothetical protein
MTQQFDNREKQEICLLIQDMLGVSFPDKYANFLVIGNQEPGCTGLSFSWETDSVLGATELLRGARPDLPPKYIVLRFDGDKAICLDLTSEQLRNDAPVITVDLDSVTPPEPRHATFETFLEAERAVTFPESEEVNDEWFLKGLEKLDNHMQKLSFEYKHDKGGKIPRSHLWRPYRFCVQDIILGITVIRHNRTFNHLDVDVFLTASIAEYEAESGCRAISLILLADAYKSGGSMEIKFSRNVEGGKIPSELVRLAGNLGVVFADIDQGLITPPEAKQLFMALSGFPATVAETISTLENAGRLSAASLCYAMHHGIWTTEEIEIILALSQAPETILANGPGPEVWHLFHYDLLIGRTAMFGSYLDRYMLHREHQPLIDDAEGTVIELEDDERLVSIGFDPVYCAKNYQIDSSESDIPLPWHPEQQVNRPLKGGDVLHVLLRARDTVELVHCLNRDIEQALEIQKANPEYIVGIMVPADYHRLDAEKKQQFREMANNVVLIVCPEFANQLDAAVWKRLDAVKVMRK